MTDITKSPRLFIDRPLNIGGNATIEGPAHHYLKNVLRIETGAKVRLFNGRDGEFAATVQSADKKAIHVVIDKQLRAQKTPEREIHLLFAPIKKESMDFLIEKAVELGATHIHPVLTQNTDVRKINEDRLHAQMIEAAEQCERLDIPTLMPAKDLFAALATWNKNILILAALERFDAQPLTKRILPGNVAVLIGPSGGFTREEMEKIAALSFIQPVSLGENILRSETAAAAALAILTV